MRAFFDLQGRELTLGRCLGRGGEGAVYVVPWRPRLVAKIYAQRPGEETVGKLVAMIALAQPELSRVAAWPLGLLLDGRGGAVVGFVMPRVEGHRPIHVLHGPKTRRAAFPEATWALLVRAARNLAAAFDVVHSHGHLIGDVNEGNVFVSPKATVRLIDCDSFQIVHDDRTYPCRVGVPLFTPPELQGRGFEGVVRTADHDRFGLAVLLFQLLFMGRHPYAGRNPSQEIAVETAIRQGLFAFGWEAARLGWEPPPFTLRLPDLPPGVGGLFEKALGREAAAGGPRPTAADWVGALDQLEARVVACDRDPRHLHDRPHGACPWCRIETEGGPSFFYVGATGAGQPRVNLAACWRAIEAVRSPGPAIPPLPRGVPGLAGRPLPPEAERERRLRNAAAAALAVLAAASLAAGQASGSIGLFLLWKLRVSEGLAAERDRRRCAVEACREELRRLESRFRVAAGDTPFVRALDRLKAVHAGLEDAPRVEEAERQRLLDTVREQRLFHHLARHALADAPIGLLGQNDLECLVACGIESAADVTAEALSPRPEMHVAFPSVSPALEASLLRWRAELERAFVFDPVHDVRPREWQHLEERQWKRREAACESLRAGAATLRACREEILARRREMQASFDELHLRLAQLEADLKQA